jgi:hypothetical protein
MPRLLDTHTSISIIAQVDSIAVGHESRRALTSGGYESLLVQSHA